MSDVVRIATGAEMRVTGQAGRATVASVDGGQAGEVEGSYEPIAGAVHGVALWPHAGRPLSLPRAHACARRVAAQLATL